jgi:hypothetical protein
LASHDQSGQATHVKGWSGSWTSGPETPAKTTAQSAASVVELQFRDQSAAASSAGTACTRHHAEETELGEPWSVGLGCRHEELLRVLSIRA